MIMKPRDHLQYSTTLYIRIFHCMISEQLASFLASGSVHYNPWMKLVYETQNLIIRYLETSKVKTTDMKKSKCLNLHLQ